MVNDNNSRATLTNVTFLGNEATGYYGLQGGAMANFLYSSTTVTNSILWDVTRREIYNSTGGGVSITYSDVRDGYTGVGNINLPPLLGPSDYYGGAAKSAALLPGSPAIDAANSDYCPATDQRGVARPQGSGCDMGAFEARPFSLSVTGGDNQSTYLNNAFADDLTVTVTGTGSDPVAGGKVTFSGPTSGAGATFTGNPPTIASDGTAIVTATANGTAGSYLVSASAAGASGVAFSLANTKSTPTFTFVLPDPFVKTYGDDSFSVADYAGKPEDDTGAITFALGVDSMGCTVASNGTVTITGANASGALHHYRLSRRGYALPGCWAHQPVICHRAGTADRDCRRPVDGLRRNGSEHHLQPLGLRERRDPGDEWRDRQPRVHDRRRAIHRLGQPLRHQLHTGNH